MTSVLDYVDVTITREIEAVTRVGFGTLLFIGETDDDGDAKQGDIVRSYGNLDEVAEVFDENDPEYLAAQAYFGQDERPERLYIGFKASGDSYSDAINDIVAVDDDWYAVAIQSRDQADIEGVAANINARFKLFLAATADEDVKDSAVDDDVASEIFDNTYDRTAVFYHSEADDDAYPECAWAGLMLPKDPGTATWAWKQLSGIPTDSFSSSERAALEDKRATYYTMVAGNPITFEGQTGQLGVFIDIIRAQDWLTFRIAEDMVARLASVDKVPYVGGDAVIEELLRNRLDIAVDRGVIAPDYEVEVPPASEQQASDRADRIYRNVTFRAQLTGAVHRIEIRGTLTV